MGKNNETDLTKLEDAFKGDKDLLLFFLTWIKHGLNATKAYMELHPNVEYTSARTLGARLFAKVDKAVILEAYGIGPQKYFEQLKDGLDAEKRDQFSGEMSADHKTRRSYHEVLGKMLGLEKDGTQVVTATQNNFFLNDDQYQRITGD